MKMKTRVEQARGSDVTLRTAVVVSRRPGERVVAGITAAVLGAAVMFLIDPARGRRRRALVRDRAVHWARRGARFAGATGRDVRNRSRGMVARRRSALERRPVDDAVLLERVRAELGRVCRHPRAIDVSVRGGDVILSGPILRDDVRRVIRSLRGVPGVRNVEDALEVRDTAGNIPALQGDGGQPPPPEPRPDVLQRHWSPATRLLAGAVGSATTVVGMRRRGWSGTLLGLSGIAFAGRAVTNLPLDRLTGAGANRRAIDIHKTIVVDAPVQRVWELWDAFERFPEFMTHVREVSLGADGRSHWVADGPAGTAMRWDAEVTKRVANEVLAWKTCPGEAIRHSGIVRFEPLGADATRVSIRMSYNPIAGATGHAVARLLGADPKRRLDDDLLRMKTLLETGRVAHDAAVRS